MARAAAARRWVAVVVWAVGVVALVAAVPAEQPAVDGQPPDESPGAPALLLELSAVVGDGELDGDLGLDDDGVPLLTLVTGARSEQVATFTYRLSNIGGVTLRDVRLTDDRIGTLLDAGLGVELSPGGAEELRASEVVTLEDVEPGGVEEWLRTATAVATTDDGVEVTATAELVVRVRSLVPSLAVELAVEVVPDVGDVALVDGLPTLTWQAAELDAGEPRAVRYRFVVTNVGSESAHRVELRDSLGDDPLLAATDEVVLVPGERTVLEVDRVVTPELAFAQADLRNVATLRVTDAAGLAFDEASAESIVVVRAPRGIVEERGPRPAPTLPAAGVPVTGLVGVASVLLAVGAAAARRRSDASA